MLPATVCTASHRLSVSAIRGSGRRCRTPPLRRQRTIVTTQRQQQQQNWRDNNANHNAQKPKTSPSRTATAERTPKIGSLPSSGSSGSDSGQSIYPESFLIGTIAGALGSVAGMGGGFVMIPLMTSSTLLGLTQHAAHGTSLFAVTATGIAGALGYGLNDVVELDTALALACCGMVTARMGAATTTKLSEITLKKALGVFMLCVAPLVPGKAYIAAMHHDPPEHDELEHEGHKEMSTARRLVPAGMIGLASGFLAGLFGVGGGAIVVPALTLATDMTHYQALGTSLCAMTLPAIVGTLTHYQRGNVAMRVAPALAVGAFVGAYVGGRVGLQVPEEKLRYGFSGLMLVLGTKTLLRV